MTTRVFPSALNPAVRANGTVSPSLSPIVASLTTRASMRGHREVREAHCASRSVEEVEGRERRVVVSDGAVMGEQGALRGERGGERGGEEGKRKFLTRTRTMVVAGRAVAS
jgi:hypothetical protein